MSAIPKALLTEEEYLRIERAAAKRSEFYHGEMFAMAGASLSHVEICGNLLYELKGRLRGGQCRVFSHDLKVRIKATELYAYPDLVLACGGLQFQDDHNDVLVNPQIIIEVLSKSTEAYDRGPKFNHYQQIPTLKEYILVSQHTPRVERFERNTNGKWELTTYSGNEATFEFGSIDGKVALADIYKDVVFDAAESNEPPPEAFKTH